MNISNPLTFRVETFQLSLSMKSQLNVNSSDPKRFDSERKIIFYKTFVSMSVKQNLFVPAFVHACLMMLNDVEYATFKMIVTPMSNSIFVISFQLMFYKTLRQCNSIALISFLFFQCKTAVIINKVCTISFERPVNYLCDAWHVFPSKYEAWTHFNN